MDLLDIDELDFDCLLKGHKEENETLAQFDNNYPDINNLKEENINPESFASSKKYYDTDTDSYYSECVDDGEIDIKQLLSP